MESLAQGKEQNDCNQVVLRTPRSFVRTSAVFGKRAPWMWPFRPNRGSKDASGVRAGRGPPFTRVRPTTSARPIHNSNDYMPICNTTYYYARGACIRMARTTTNAMQKGNRSTHTISVFPSTCTIIIIVSQTVVRPSPYLRTPGRKCSAHPRVFRRWPVISGWEERAWTPRARPDGTACVAS